MSKSVVTSRRSFIKGAVAGAVSAGVAPVMAAPAPQNGLPAKWDGEADVVIVGFGGAGATTGIVAASPVSIKLLSRTSRVLKNANTTLIALPIKNV